MSVDALCTLIAKDGQMYDIVARGGSHNKPLVVTENGWEPLNETNPVVILNGRHMTLVRDILTQCGEVSGKMYENSKQD